MGHGVTAGPGDASGGVAGAGGDLCGLGWPALDALVAGVLGARREAAVAQAREARLLAQAVDLVTSRVEERRLQGERVSDADLPLREVSLELGMAMRVSDRTVQGRMGDGHLLVTLFPETLAAWEAGRVDAGHVWAIVHAGAGIGDDDRRARFEQLALAAAVTESAGRMGRIAREIAAAVSPEDFAAEVRAGFADRMVRVRDLTGGIARLIADLPAPLAYAIADRLTQDAEHALTAEREARDNDVPDQDDVSAAGDDTGGADRDGREDLDVEDHDRGAGAGGTGQPGPGEARVVTGPGRLPGIRTGGGTALGGADPGCVRTLDQARADVLADLLLTGTPALTGTGDPAAAITARVQITIPAVTLAGAGDAPALLDGHGPIDPALARRLAGTAPEWIRVFTDPHTGLPVAVDTYRPSAALRRFLTARDERCRTPGCTRTAARCDIDHNHDAAHGGPTAPGNLCHFCRRHHVAKHRTAWRVRQLPGGVIEWTGPTGRRYLDHPPATVRFVPDTSDEPPPF